MSVYHPATVDEMLFREAGAIAVNDGIPEAVDPSHRMSARMRRASAGAPS